MSEKRLMIILNDKFKSDKNIGEDSSTSSNLKGTSPTASSSAYNAYSYQFFDHGNFEKMNVHENEMVVKKPTGTNKESYIPHFEQHSSYIDDEFFKTSTFGVDHNRFGELESVTSKSKHRKGNPYDMSRLPLLLQVAMSNDNSIIHYHEHEHVHRHKNLPSRFKQSDSSRVSFYPSQSFESTKNYYHQRDFPNKKITRNRNNSYEQSEQGYSDQYNPVDESEYRNGFGQKKHPKFKRGDVHFKRHRNYDKLRPENH